MGSARDSAPDPKRASGLARLPWPPRVRLLPTSTIASATPPRPAEAPARGEAKISSLIPVPPGARPLGQQPKLLDRLREAVRARHYSPRTEESYRHWAKRYIFFHNVRHSAEMAESESTAFLTHLVVKEKGSASTQTQALSALLFRSRHGISREVGDLGAGIRARTPTRLPVVRTREAGKAVRVNVTGDTGRRASLMDGARVRLMARLRLRVQDIDVSRNEMLGRDGTGAKDRIPMLPESRTIPRQAHLKKGKAIHAWDLAEGGGRVQMPTALDRTYLNAPTDWRWQWVIPQDNQWSTPKTKEQGRQHIDKSLVQKAVRDAVAKAGLTKRALGHTFRHSFATQVLEGGYDIRPGQELLGHSDVKTTMISTHVLNRGPAGVRSPVDGL